jgi:hypothetical protein
VVVFNPMFKKPGVVSGFVFDIGLLWRSGMNRKQVGILLFDNIEVLDFCGPFEVF